MNRDASYYERLVRELIAIPRETEWLELKHNKDDPAEIGEYLSALANSAALFGKAWAYVLWGIDDQTHLMVGTTFDPVTRKIGNEELESWLLRQLTPKIEFRFRKVFIEGHIAWSFWRSAAHFATPFSLQVMNMFGSGPTRKN
jgi:predicted HTH transcriptional regulator